MLLSFRLQAPVAFYGQAHKFANNLCGVIIEIAKAYLIGEGNVSPLQANETRNIVVPQSGKWCVVDTVGFE